MTKYTLFLLGLMFGLAACAPEEKPHLSREQMVAVLTDIHLSEVYSTLVNDSTHQMSNKNLDSLAVYYQGVLGHHGLSMKEFEQNLHWYADHPNEMDSVYISMQEELSTIEGLLNAVPENN